MQNFDLAHMPNAAQNLIGEHVVIRLLFVGRSKAWWRGNYN